MIEEYTINFWKAALLLEWKSVMLFWSPSLVNWIEIFEYRVIQYGLSGFFTAIQKLTLSEFANVFLKMLNEFLHE